MTLIVQNSVPAPDVTLPPAPQIYAQGGSGPALATFVNAATLLSERAQFLRSGGFQQTLVAGFGTGGGTIGSGGLFRRRGSVVQEDEESAEEYADNGGDLDVEGDDGVGGGDGVGSQDAMGVDGEVSEDLEGGFDAEGGEGGDEGAGEDGTYGAAEAEEEEADDGMAIEEGAEGESDEAMARRLQAQFMDETGVALEDSDEAGVLAAVAAAEAAEAAAAARAAGFGSARAQPAPAGAEGDGDGSDEAADMFGVYSDEG